MCYKEIIIFVLSAVLVLSFALPVEKINIANPSNQGIITNQNPVKEILIPAQTMFRKGNWKSSVGLGNYGTGYTGIGGYSGYGGYGGYGGYAGGYAGGYQPGGYAGGYQPGSYGWRTG